MIAYAAMFSPYFAAAFHVTLSCREHDAFSVISAA